MSARVSVIIPNWNGKPYLYPERVLARCAHNRLKALGKKPEVHPFEIGHFLGLLKQHFAPD